MKERKKMHRKKNMKPKEKKEDKRCKTEKKVKKKLHTLHQNGKCSFIKNISEPDKTLSKL